ncbi:hypothetical protein [Pseudobacteroides cellulosolvens]|uniref:Lipoprotein n=1 Tax=Pseudobacteroides cellulosolvens ATCC 35603 = DSM 2933 TaxID=398512 RepID=A0A0L6JVA8_9FIRM|nr:hypothetical protein [Pseudobacteroides cellulosolvens]KNY29664.1 hypothetical protein Bccel_4938 [Pseudobacteroides cellulosolvens ATCC 35603 = DSM 2933]
MKKFKIAGIILLVAILAFSSVGCGGIDKEEVSKGEIISNEKSSEKPSEASEKPSDKPSEKPSEEPSEKTDKKLDLGKNEGDTYKNDYFGLSVKLPKGWKVASDEEKKQVLNMGKQVVAGDDKAKQAEVELAEAKSVYLLMVSKIGMNQQSYDNGNFMIMAEKLSFLQGINKGSQYLEHVKKGLQDVKAQMPYKLDKPIYSEKIGGKEFAVLDAVMESEQLKLTQKYYAYVMKGYALVFIGTSTNDENAKIIQGMLDSMKFE